MPEEWHHFRYPGPEIGQQVLTQDEIDALGLDRWRELPRAQTPPWPDPSVVDEVGEVLNTVPPIVAPYEVDQLRDRLALPHFRPYLSDDIVGAEIGGAVKNVLAIACGVVEGRGLGLNARASLISRGFADGPALGHVLTLAEEAWLAADFPLDESELAAIADQAAARFARDHRL